jgi:hypothetical protein
LGIIALDLLPPWPVLLDKLLQVESQLYLTQHVQTVLLGKALSQGGYVQTVLLGITALEAPPPWPALLDKLLRVE